ncbi:MAG TPA: DUF1080 domain-containing protein [Chitinophagaceae bacterium]|jgi:hypothetical protein
MKKALLLGCVAFLSIHSLRAQQFHSLFNGKNFDGWYIFLHDKNVSADSVFTVEDGMIHVSGRSFGYVCTNDSYKNFHLILEFKWGIAKYPPRQNAKRDSGVLYYFSSSAPDKVWPRSFECQVQEGDCGDFWLVDSTSLTVNGKLYPPTKNQQVVKFSNQEKPNNEWNTLEIIGNNGKCTHILNGTIVNEGTDANVREGKILLQCEGSEIYYRNIRLAVL